ncbi:MAG: bifunctional DNA primase/polymerase [Minisyncoccia bacterium]
MENIKTNLEWALYYRSIGWSPFPVVKGGKVPSIEWKKYQNEIASEEEINNWWKQNPEANIGIATGLVSGVIVLDIDSKHNRTSKEFQIPPTICAKTGGLGEHILFKHPGGHVKSTNGQLFGSGVDLKADGGYVVLTPSLHESGNRYEWIIGPDETELAEVPIWLRAALEGQDKNADAKLWQKGASGVSEGNRNETAASVAGKLRSSLPKELVEDGWENLIAWNKKNPEPLPEEELKRVWDSVKKYDSEEEAPAKESPATKLLKLIRERKDVTIFRDFHGDAFIALEIEGVRQVWSCKSDQFQHWLSLLYFHTYKTVLPSDAKTGVVGTIKGFATFEKEVIHLQSRNAYFGDELWYDMTNDKWQAIKVTQAGWELVDKPPILFRRYSHNKAQVMPLAGGDARLLLKYFNISDPQQQLLILIHIISAFIPGFAHPILVINGPQGSAKSTFSRILRLIIDPSIMEVASMPDTHRELVQTLAHNSFIFFDNVSWISETVSDILCKAVTGSSFPKRELYSDDDDVIYTFMRTIGINGISMFLARPDLLERSIILKLDRIDSKNRKLEKSLMTEFEHDLPSILGGIFDVLVKTLALKPTIEQENLPRMADFALWGCAVAEALGVTQKEFMDSYNTNIALQTDIVINENLIASTIISFMQDQERDEWVGTATGLLHSLGEFAKSHSVDVHDKQWPKAHNVLSRRLNELKINFLEAGWDISIDGGQVRKITIRWIGKKPNVPIPNTLTRSEEDFKNF